MSSRPPLRAALLNFGYWPEIRRGNERLVHDLATEFARRGSDITILTSHPGRPSRAQEEGVTVVRSRRPPEQLLRLRRIQEQLTHLPATHRELRRTAPQVAHSFFATDGLAGLRWARRAGGRAVFTLTGFPGRENLANVRFRRRIIEAVTTGSDAVVTISLAARDETWRWLAIEPEVIYPGVDLELFAPGERAPVPTIACAADPGDQRKRVGLLVSAFARVRRERPDAELLLVAPADRALAAELSEREGVRLLPGDADTAPAMLRSAWVSALCSYSEAFGLVVVESLACGTPVVGARSGAIPEIIDRPDVGGLFDEPKEREVARLLLAELEKQGDAATASACRARASDFSITRSAEAHELLYERLVAG